MNKEFIKEEKIKTKQPLKKGRRNFTSTMETSSKLAMEAVNGGSTTQNKEEDARRRRKKKWRTDKE